jgi:hypothetical protein
MTFSDRGLSPEPGVFIEKETIESIQYQDLAVPSIMRQQMGEAAWTNITLEELGDLFAL